MEKTGKRFDERKKQILNPLKGRPRTAFGSVEEERDYLQAQVDYLKKRYPNLVKEKRLSQRENYDILDELRLLAWHYTPINGGRDPSIQLLQMASNTAAEKTQRQDRDREIKEHMMAIHFT